VYLSNEHAGCQCDVLTLCRVSVNPGFVPGSNAFNPVASFFVFATCISAELCLRKKKGKEAAAAATGRSRLGEPQLNRSATRAGYEGTVRRGDALRTVVHAATATSSHCCRCCRWARRRVQPALLAGAVQLNSRRARGHAAVAVRVYGAAPALRRASPAAPPSTPPLLLRVC
jgi:hypothetical protein